MKLFDVVGDAVRRDRGGVAPDSGDDARPRHAFGWPTVIGGLAVGGMALGIASNWPGFAAAGLNVTQALWLLPGLVALHLGQLFLAGVAWRTLFVGSRPGVVAFYRLRVIREGIDSLLPVAQVGGEIVGARLLSQRGVRMGQAAASVIVDVTVELLTQVAFLAAGLCALAWLSRNGAWGGAWGTWIKATLAGMTLAASLILAQRFGLLRALEALLRGMARRWPTLAGASLDGVHAAALDFYRQPAALVRSAGLHLLAWTLGSVETWAILHAFSLPATPLQAFTVESLGMAARSAGFAIPAALGAQEGGFVLAAAAIGVPVAPALALSLVKRLRECLVGLVGLALWRTAVSRPASPCPASW